MTDEPMTTAEWMALPLTEEDVAYIHEFLTRLGGFNSSWPWPMLTKVLDAAQWAAERETERVELRELCEKQFEELKILRTQRDEYREQWVQGTVELAERGLRAITAMHEALDEANARLTASGAALEALVEQERVSSEAFHRAAIRNGEIDGQLATALWERDNALGEVERQTNVAAGFFTSLAELTDLIQNQGFKVVEGDFTYRSGMKGRHYLRVIAPRRLLRIAMNALESEEGVR